MTTAEHLAFSIRQERGSVHILLWDEQEDLVRALVILHSLTMHVDIVPLLVEQSDERIQALRRLIETRVPIADDHTGVCSAVAEVLRVASQDGIRINRVIPPKAEMAHECDIA